MTLDLHELVAPLRARPDASLLAFDFDGTLSPTVDDPAAAVAAPGAFELLDELAATYLRVAVLSGRPVAFLAGVVPASVELSGLYGLERRTAGVVSAHPDADRWRVVIDETASAALEAAAPGAPLDGMVVEPKGLSITLHTRTRPELSAASVELAQALAHSSGLELRPAKMSVELHPPVLVDKGTALQELAAGASAVLFAGDDVGDLPAFDALASLRPGVATVAVAIDGPELPIEITERAPFLLPGQATIIDLLRALLI